MDNEAGTGMKINARAGQPADASDLVDVAKLITAYYEDRPDPREPEQRVVFGTSGHRGSSFERSFNEWHILAITQAICLYRQQRGIDGPLFLGIDTHALSRPALASALEVLAGNDVDVMFSEKNDYTPTPVISHAILAYNHGRQYSLCDGIVITPSHNPPEWGGFKYNPPHGGPAEEKITGWIESKVNKFLTANLRGIKRISFEKALSSSTTHKHDYLTAYGQDLHNIIDMEVIRNSGITCGVDPLGGAGAHYWEPIAERYGLDLKILK
jgi:phosphoglucomutase